MPNLKSSGIFMPFRQEDVEQSIAHRFQQQVAQYPDNIAVKTDDGFLTYDSLNSAANRVARAILGRTGEKREQAVALLLENGAAIITAILGTLKAGKIYVPMDPTHPRTRIAHMVERSGAGLIITDRQHLALAQELSGKSVPLINVEEINNDLSEENLDNSHVSADSVTAIYYTSGSTGVPKGVQHTHRTILHLVMTCTNRYGIRPDDRIPLLFSCGFGASRVPIFGALLNGATLYPYNLKSEGIFTLAERVTRDEITIMFMVPTTFREFCDSFAGEEWCFSKLRLTVLGGEPLFKRDVQAHRGHFPASCVFLNQFAATETGVISWFEIDGEKEVPGDIVPVGYAAPDKEILLLDDDGNEVGADQPGEIAVRSRYLTPGYWREPDLAQAAFSPRNPAAGAKRIYRTGDMGRMLPDGCLLHLGRKDLQVKVRGHRIEMAEVEKALLNVPGVIKAAVAAREDAHRDKRLVAYLVPDERSALTVGRLRAELRKTLPDYMVPSAFVFMDALPLTASGKVDRQALPGPPPLRPVLDTDCVAPRNALEERLTKIWETVLGVQPIGVKDNFFELGGNSLSGARLFAEIEAALGKSIPLTLLLQSPTIEQLAAALGRDEWQGQWSSIIALQPEGSKPPLFCVDPRNAGVFVHLARHLGSNQPCFGLHPLGLVASRKAHFTIESLASHFLDEVRKIQPEGPYFLCGFCAGGTIASEMAQQLKAQGSDIAFLAMLDSFRPRPTVLPYAIVRPMGRLRRLVLRPLAKHLRNLSRLKLGRKLGYIRSVVAEARKRRAMRVTRRAARKTSEAHNKYLLQLRIYTHGLRRATRRALLHYRPQVYRGRLLLFTGSESPVNPSAGSQLSWAELATEGAEAHTVPGRHQYILSEPNVSILAERFKARLEEAQQSASGKAT